MKLNLDFFIHWLWAAVFGLLTLSGLALMGARYGWILNYSLGIADFIHRTMAALFVVLLAISILLEILRMTINFKVSIWMMVGTKPYQIFTLITSLLFILSGIFIWVCMEISMNGLVFSLVVHEVTTFLALGSIIWHIYDKAHALKL